MFLESNALWSAIPGHFVKSNVSRQDERSSRRFSLKVATSATDWPSGHLGESSVGSQINYVGIVQQSSLLRRLVEVAVEIVFEWSDTQRNVRFLFVSSQK